MMPAAISFGLSYSDFWSMTWREIRDFLKFAIDKEKTLIERKERHELICAASSAYHSGYFSRVQANYFPESLEKAFPALFGLTTDGKIPVDNWQAGKEQMKKIADSFNAKYKRKAVSSNGDDR